MMMYVDVACVSHGREAGCRRSQVVKAQILRICFASFVFTMHGTHRTRERVVCVVCGVLERPSRPRHHSSHVSPRGAVLWGWPLT